MQPRALILECPFDRLLSAVRNRCRLVGLPAFPSAEALVFWGGMQQGYWAFDHNPADYAAAVRCPVLLMHGDEDRRVSRDEMLSIFNGLACEKQLVVFQDAGHGVYLSRNRQRWTRSVDRFLSASGR